MGYFYLLIAIVAEVIGTSALKASEEFSKLQPTLLVLVGYGIAFYFLSLALKTIPIGITYAIWSGTGIVLISLVGLIFFKQSLDLPATFGIILIISGVAIINLYSRSVAH